MRTFGVGPKEKRKPFTDTSFGATEAMGSQFPPRMWVAATLLTVKQVDDLVIFKEGGQGLGGAEEAAPAPAAARATISSFKRAKPDGLAATITPSAFVDALRLVLLTTVPGTTSQEDLRRHCTCGVAPTHAALTRRSGDARHHGRRCFPGETEGAGDALFTGADGGAGYWARRTPLLNTYLAAWHAKAANDVNLAHVASQGVRQTRRLLHALAHLPIPELVAMMTGGVVQTPSKTTAGDAPSPDLLSLWLRSGCLCLRSSE